MSLLRKPFGRPREDVATVETDQYIDLGALHFDDEAAAGKGMIKIAEIYRYEDISLVTQQVYNGATVLVDYSQLANDSLSLKRITAELKAAARDVNGDVAAIGHDLIVVAPSGIRIDRQKIKGGFQ